MKNMTDNAGGNSDTLFCRSKKEMKLCCLK